MKKGFTLVELLAVIVILSIVMLISFPAITKIVSKVRAEAFKSTNQSIITRLEQECLYKNLKESDNEITYPIIDGKIENVMFKGKLPEHGVIKSNSKCQVKLWSYNNQFCAIKEYDSVLKIGTILQEDCILNETEKIDLNNHKTAYEMYKQMGIGWNLGNTLDSYIEVPKGTETVEKYETYWGNPVTTKSMIDKVAKAGFKTLRIPISWFQHLDQNNTIDIVWLNRVKEIVDYGLDNNMYVIIDTHHEKWLDLGDEHNYQAYETKLVHLWEQIAQYFKDYDQRLIFEILNEPRDIDGDLEWDGTEKMNDFVFSLSRSVVHKIREINGEKRIIIVTPYGGRVNSKYLTKFSSLNDGYTMLSVHSYEPYYFTSEKNETFDDRVANKMYNVIINEIKKFKESSMMPIIVTEMGCIDKDDYEDWRLYMNFYIEQLSSLNIPLVLWDSGKLETSGLFDRIEMKWNNPLKIDTIFNSFRVEKSGKEEKLVNRIETINKTTNYTLRNINSETQQYIDYGVRKVGEKNHYYIKTIDGYNHDNSLYFRFNDTYKIDSKDGFLYFTCDFKTNSRKIYIRAILNFYDEDDNLIYADDYNSNVLIDTDQNTNFDIQKKTRLYYVPGAKKVKIDRISTSASFQKNDSFDIEISNLSLTDGTIAK